MAVMINENIAKSLLFSLSKLFCCYNFLYKQLWSLSEIDCIQYFSLQSLIPSLHHSLNEAAVYPLSNNMKCIWSLKRTELKSMIYLIFLNCTVCATEIWLHKFCKMCGIQKQFIFKVAKWGPVMPFVHAYICSPKFF